MPASTPMPTKNPGDVLTSTLWNSYLRDNIDKVLTRGHRSLTVAQFGALTGLEGTAGTVPGDEVYLIADAATGVLWHLVYESTETTYKWRYIGGPPLVVTLLTAEGTSSATYVDLTTPGPTVVAPRAGDYDVAVGSMGASSSANDTYHQSYTVGAVASSDVWAHRSPCSSFGFGSAAEKTWRQAAVAASASIKAQYKCNTGAVTFSNRVIRLTPVRII